MTKRILLVALMAIALSGCATLSNMYNRAKDCVYPKPVEVVKPLPLTPAPPVEPLIKVPEPKESFSPRAESVTPRKPRRIKYRKPKPAPKKLPFESKKEDLNKDLQKEPTPPPK